MSYMPSTYVGFAGPPGSRAASRAAVPGLSEQDRLMAENNPLKRFPAKTRRLAPSFRSHDTRGLRAENEREIEKRGRWLDMQKLDPQMGLYTNTTNHSTKQEVFIRRTYRRMESSTLFQPPRMGASLAELSDPPAPDTQRYVLVEESRLTELARIEAILKEEKEALGEQCSWVMNDYHIDARIPIPATRVAINSLCDADMRRLASEFDVMRAAWRKYSFQQRYFRDMNNSSLPAQSYLANAPLAQRPSKFVLLDAERLARQLMMERDTMMYEDDCSFLDNAYFRASSRKKDYERYYILASRYGRMTEEEFMRDERPGRRYWSRALDGCLKFQRIWGAYWAVQSLRRYKGAKGLQKIVRGYLAYKKYHPLIVFRLKYGKSSYLSYSMRRWRAYNRLLKNCRESIAWWLEDWSVQCFSAWQRFTIASREEKARMAAQNRAKRMHSGLLKCFNAWSWLAKRQKYIKMKARRLLGCPHFDMWMDFVETKKHLRKMFNTASKIQSVARMFLCRRVFKAKRKLGFRFGIVLRSRYKVDMRRNAAVTVNFQEWKVVTEDKRAVVLLDAERARLHNMQAYVVEREKASRLELRRHLRSRAGKLQLKEASRSLLSSVAWQKEQAEKLLYESCLTLSRRFALRDFHIANPPAFRCVDPTCCATFTSEKQYHLHYKYAANHRSARSAQQRGNLSSSSSNKISSTLTSSSDSSTGSSRKKEAKAMLLQDKLKEQLKAAEAAYAARSEQYSAELAPLLERLETKQGELQTKRQELDAGEDELRTLKLNYAKESKATKEQVEELERTKPPTMRMDIKRLNDANIKSTKAYNSQKKELGDKVAQMQSAADALAAVVADLEQKVAALQAETKQFDDQFAADSDALKASLEAAKREQAAKEEAERKKREAEESDLYSSLTPSTLHCLLMHPTKFLVLRGVFLRLLPEGAVIKPPPPTDEELALQEAQRQAAALKAKEEAEAEALALASVIKVKGWTFVKGKGWVASKPSEKRRFTGKGQAAVRGGAKGDGDRATANPLGQIPRNVTGSSSSSSRKVGIADGKGKGKGALAASKKSKSTKRAMKTETTEGAAEDGALSGGAGAGGDDEDNNGGNDGEDDDNGDDSALDLDALEDTPASPVDEPKRNNALPEVHLLNCLDLWKAIHAWKATMPSSHPSYTVRALQIFDAFLAPDDEAEAGSWAPFAAGKGSDGTVIKGGSGPSGKKRGVFSAFLRRLRAIFPKFSFNKFRGGGDGEEDDSDIESDIESDSDDDDETKKTKAERRFKRDEEARQGVIVRRTVNLSVLTSHESWSPAAAEAMLQRLARIKDKNKGQKRASVKYFCETKETRSWWRRTLRLKARGFQSWSSDFVVPPDVFDGLQWALFTYLFDKIRNESGFEKSPSFGLYRLLCAADDAARERDLFRDAKLARLDRFRRWARDEFLANLRAWYKMAEDCSWRASDRAISSLVDRALRLCVDEFVWTSQLQEQQRIETTNMVADEAVTWTMVRVADDWYESLMDPFVRSLIALGGDVRASLMEFCGMREKAAVPMRKRAYSVRQVKGINIEELLASMETSGDKDEDEDSDSDSESDDEDEGGEKGESEGKNDSPPQTSTAAAGGRGVNEEKEAEPAKKLTSAQRALLEMQQQGHFVDKSVLVTTTPKRPNKRISTAEGVVCIQRRVRGNQGRKRGRAAFVKVWVKRFDPANQLPFYSNVALGSSQWTPPSIYAKLFPWTSKVW